VLSRNRTAYHGRVQLVDGYTGTSFPDFINWVFHVVDPNDTDQNGVPDISDAILVPPAIQANPQDLTVTMGQPATFTVRCAGNSLHYQWYKDGLIISRATNTTFKISSVKATDAGLYSVRVFNALDSVESIAARLTVVPKPVAPTITTQPKSVSVPIGATFNLSVIAVGTQPLTYQWYKNGVLIAGAKNSSLTVSNAKATDAGTYYAMVSNVAGKVRSSNAVVSITRTTSVIPMTEAVNGDLLHADIWDF